LLASRQLVQQLQLAWQALAQQVIVTHNALAALHPQGLEG
jgi:hypothetical protein